MACILWMDMAYFMEANRVILSYLATGTITQLYSQFYAGSIVMLTGVYTCANVC